MSRLNELLRRIKAEDAGLGEELEREVRALSSRRAFGLNFERHRPEAVELPNRPVRRGDKVRIQPERGTTKQGDPRLWQVQRIQRVDGQRVAHLIDLDADPDMATPETRAEHTDDLLVIAEFRDPIYPGLTPTGNVHRTGPDTPAHTVINGENYHVLKALTYTHKGKVDAIYIDPPYNTGAKDWKYNNNYVDSEDVYRHSKWLAFMDRRLQIAKELLNPDDSALIVTIDEKEVHRLGLLLEQVFPDAQVQMVTTMTNKKGSTRPGRFSRAEEYVFYLMFGAAKIAQGFDNMMLPAGDDAERAAPRITIWNSLLRRGTDALRQDRPNMFYPIYVEPETRRIVGVGAPLALDGSRHDVAFPRHLPPDTTTSWPLRRHGVEGRWQVGRETLLRLIAEGRARAGAYNATSQQHSIVVVKDKQMAQIAEGLLEVDGRDEAGALQIKVARDGVAQQTYAARSIWVRDAHDASVYGSTLLSSIMPGRKFPFPKSLYAVEDTLRFVVSDKPDAVVLDFFAGSGTTAHAVMRLNRQDGGRRQCISVTNNEVAAEEHIKLRRQGLRPGDPDWEALGICDYVTKPRIEAAIIGNTPEGQPIKGDYRFTDEFPMADGFEQNAEFFTLTYETPIAVSHNRAFSRIAPLLWLRAGAQGPQIDAIPDTGWATTDTYGVLFDLDQAGVFAAAIEAAADARMAYVVTDDERRFQAVAQRLPDHVEPVRLYESYLSNFRFVNGE